MKKNLLVIAGLLCAAGAFAQGQIRFDNRVTGTTSSAVVAPIYGVDSADRFAKKNGNAATGPTTPIPTGTQTYGGAPLTGSGFTASLWARPAGSASAFQQFATTPFRVTTSTTLFGFWTIPNTAITLTGIASDPAVRAEIIIRVWDNKGGSITSWDQLYDAATGAANLQNASVARGESSPFTEQDQLGGGTVLPATLKGLQSFQLYEVVPEPSVIALGVLGAGCLFLLRRRK
jgi:hypothetical protein